MSHELKKKLQELQEKVDVLESERSAARQKAAARRRLLKRATLGASFLVVLGALGLSTGVLAAGGDCYSGLACFTANTPAKAGEVNDNFYQLASWLEGKVGDVTSNDVTIDGATLTRNISATGTISATGSITSSVGFHGIGGHGGAYAHFSHKEMTGSGEYAVLQNEEGQTYINAASGMALYFRIANATKMSISSAGAVTVNTNLTVHNCPSGWNRYGDNCIENLERSGTFTSAMSTCHSIRASVCDLATLMICDSLGGSAACVTATDHPTDQHWLWAGGSIANDANAYGAVRVYADNGNNTGAGGNEVDYHDHANSYHYFCCRQL